MSSILTLDVDIWNMSSFILRTKRLVVTVVYPEKAIYIEDKNWFLLCPRYTNMIPRTNERILMLNIY